MPQNFLGLTKIGVLRSFIYRSRKALWPKLVILCYHRIENYITDPVKITVSKNNFFKHIDFLKEFAHIIHPDQLFESLTKRKNLPRRSILLTFDDGYSSYKDTMQFLKKEFISAMFFITIRKKKHWWDILSKLLFHHQHVENNVYKEINNILANRGYAFKIEEYIDSNSIQTLRNWDITKAKFPFKRNKAFYLLARAMEESNYFESNSLLESLSGLTNETRDFSYLDEKNLIDYHKLGFHTINHFNLSKLSYNNQKKEIEIGKKSLDARLGKNVETFAYPFGNKIHYNNDTLKIVKKNFKYAFSNFEGLVHKDSNIYELPRFLVRDWDVDNFIIKVKTFFKEK